MSISNIYVPNEGDPASKLWLVGEAPGWHEQENLRPFIGESGVLLETTLGQHGFSRSDVFFTNLCHYRPPGNKFEALLGSDQLREGLQELKALLSTYKPNVVAALGGFPLKYLTGKNGITKYRGSILRYESSDLGALDHEIKVIPAFHPAYITRNRALYPIFSADIARITADSKFPELKWPELDIVIDPVEMDYWRDEILKHEYVACDIEGVKGTTDIICVGFSYRVGHSVVIPYRDNIICRDFLESILSSKVKKIFHFGTYDAPMLRLNGYTVNNYTEDTLVQAHVLVPELPRDLAYLTSMETRIPYYKSEGRKELPGDVKGWSAKRNKNDVYIYNGKDCCATIEIFFNQKKYLEDSGQIDYYNYRMSLQDPLLEMGEAGLLRDEERRQFLAKHFKKARAIAILQFRGLAGRPVNTGSNPQMVNLFYKELKLPERKKTDRKTGKVRLTCDEDALVSLITFCTGKVRELKQPKAIQDWEIKRQLLKLAIAIRGHDKLISSYLDVAVRDGRASSSYKLAGTETGRPSNIKFVDSSGMNMTTIPRDKYEIPND